MKTCKKTKNKQTKKTLTKTLKQSTKKQNLGENMNNSKSHIKKKFFENIFSGIQLFYIRPHVPVDIFRISSVQKVSQPAKTTERSLILQHIFTQKTSLILQTSTYIENNMVLQNSQNLSEFTKNFPVNMLLFSFWKTFAFHHFLTPKTAFLKHFESKCPYISVYLRKTRRCKIFFWEVGWERLNIFIKAARFLDLA